MSAQELEFQALILRALWYIMRLQMGSDKRKWGHKPIDWRKDAMNYLQADEEDFEE